MPPPWIMKPSMTRWNTRPGVEALVDVREEVLHRLGRLVGVELDREAPHRRLHDDGRVRGVWAEAVKAARSGRRRSTQVSVCFMVAVLAQGPSSLLQVRAGPPSGGRPRASAARGARRAASRSAGAGARGPRNRRRASARAPDGRGAGAPCSPRRIVSEIRFLSRSTSRTRTCTRSPAFTTSRGSFTKRSGELRDVDEAVLVDADVDEGAEGRHVGDDARADHPGLQVLELVHVVAELRRLERVARVAAGLLQLADDVVEREGADVARGSCRRPASRARPRGPTSVAQRRRAPVANRSTSA